MGCAGVCRGVLGRMRGRKVAENKETPGGQSFVMLRTNWKRQYRNQGDPKSYDDAEFNVSTIRTNSFSTKILSIPQCTQGCGFV